MDVDGVRLLTDPVMRARIGPLVRVAPPVAADAARGIDAILISHLHADHADGRSLRMLGPGTLVIAPEGAGGWLRGQGMSNVRELARGSQTTVVGVSITATPAVHEGGRWRYGRRADSVGYIAAGSLSCYFAGDTDLFDEMAEMAGELDAALLPVSGWGPTLGPGHLDPARSAIAAGLIAPRVAIPIHWGTLALPSARLRPDDPAAPARDFAERAARHAPDVDVRVLMPGESTVIEPVSTERRP
jgi:L-ascorbate metabolism protein UlaG (beta-lactamase superfamily)